MYRTKSRFKSASQFRFQAQTTTKTRPTDAFGCGDRKAIAQGRHFLGWSVRCFKNHSGAKWRQIFKARPKRAQKRNVASDARNGGRIGRALESPQLKIWLRMTIIIKHRASPASTESWSGLPGSGRLLSIQAIRTSIASNGIHVDPSHVQWHMDTSFHPHATRIMMRSQAPCHDVVSATPLRRSLESSWQADALEVMRGTQTINRLHQKHGLHPFQFC